MPHAPRFAVLGSPIAHSRSPALHQAAYRALGLNWRYEAHEVRAGELESFIDVLGPEWRGLSLTMPLKHEVLPLIDDLDLVAQLTGSVNTVLITPPGGPGGPRRLSGFNTDVAGLVRALAENGVTRARHVTLLGAGATASSAVVAAAELGAADLAVIVRDPTRALALVELGTRVGLTVTVSPLTELAQAQSTSDLVISTLPGGSTISGEFPTALRRHVPLFDVAYSPWPSALAMSWQASGGTVLSGLGMLLHQALIQDRIFVGGDPLVPLDGEDEVLAAMRGVLTRDPVEG
ncbi:shikimate dehydrogenase [Cryobacterium sp. CG_9.6]|uniref:shikimate dehydrogenase n=1 Tax=Cryobacterium sp. CG_9.6 TaxID=2760710 RepID=UPI0024732C06|nr:shikimate dehydrogenase [Cryobacterium sp. CG_9.6]MDH6237298.1 shikimate dehydrogenase [Cryobacterium sp. CG_9.6]